MHGAWITTDTTGRWYPSAQTIASAGFTTPTYYEQPLYNATLQNSISGGTWGIAKAPNANQITGPMTQGQQLLSAQQQADVSRLFTMCFGDEENYSTDLVTWLGQYYSTIHQQYPSVLVHNNQYAGQWTKAQLQSYLTSAQPDMLTWDSYYFSDTKSYAGQSVTPLYNTLATYRSLALGGYDGTGQSPIVFGQYTQGFKTGSSNTYIVSESQIELVSNLTWTVGGKWLDLFRWEASTTSVLTNPDGSNTPQFSQYSALNGKISKLSKYLVRLNSTDARIVLGQDQTSSGPVTNPTPSLPVWQSRTIPYITGVSVSNQGSTNSGLPGDVVLGAFAPLPGLSSADASVLPSSSGQYFMLANCLTAPLDDPTNANSTGGTGASTKQAITLTFDLGTQSPNALRFVNQHTGAIVAVTLTSIGGTKYSLTRNLEGGTSEFFFWA